MENSLVGKKLKSQHPSKMHKVYIYIPYPSTPSKLPLSRLTRSSPSGSRVAPRRRFGGDLRRRLRRKNGKEAAVWGRSSREERSE